MFETPNSGEMPEAKWVPGADGEELETDLSESGSEAELLRAREGQRSPELQMAAEAAAELMDREERKKAAAEALRKMEEDGTVN